MVHKQIFSGRSNQIYECLSEIYGEMLIELTGLGRAFCMDKNQSVRHKDKRETIFIQGNHREKFKK